MFLGRPKTEACFVCGETIPAKDSRVVDRNAAAKTTRHRHINCDPTMGTTMGDSGSPVSTPSLTAGVAVQAD